MRLAHTELFVKDPLASRDFYERVLGFEVMEVQHQGKVIWMNLGERIVMLRAGPPPRQVPNYQHSGAALVFFTDDLPAKMADLKSRGLVFDGNDGPNCPTFKDPDGHWFQLVDPKHA